jgi:hypothetical protein
MIQRDALRLGDLECSARVAGPAAADLPLLRSHLEQGLSLIPALQADIAAEEAVRRSRQDSEEELRACTASLRAEMQRLVTRLRALVDLSGLPYAPEQARLGTWQAAISAWSASDTWRRVALPELLERTDHLLDQVGLLGEQGLDLSRSVEQLRAAHRALGAQLAERSAAEAAAASLLERRREEVDRHLQATRHLLHYAALMLPDSAVDPDQAMPGVARRNAAERERVRRHRSGEGQG